MSTIQRPPQPTAYPSPPFLCTPAKEGSQNPQDLEMYKTYLIHQLRRGVSPKASMQAAALKNGEHLRLALNECQVQCLQVLATGPAKAPEIAAATGVPIRDISRQLANLRKRELATNKRPPPGTGVFGTWTITAAGRKVLKMKVGESHG